MQVVIKNGFILASHRDDQAVSDKYPGCEVVWVLDTVRCRDVAGLPMPDPRPGCYIGVTVKKTMEQRLTDIETAIVQLRVKVPSG